MRKCERETIQKVCDYFDYHNKNLTKTQIFLIEDLKDLLASWKIQYKILEKTEAAAKARAKYWKKFKKTHKKQIKERHHEYYLANRERIRERQKAYREKKLSQTVHK